MPGKNSTDNCVVSLVHFGDEMYAMTETPFLRRVDPETLETIGDKVLGQSVTPHKRHENAMVLGSI